MDIFDRKQSGSIIVIIIVATKGGYVNMLLLSKEDIKKVFSMKDAIEADKEAFRIFSEGKSVVPLRTNIPAPKHEGAFLFMPAYVADLDCASLKIVNIFPKNIDKGIPSAPAQVLLIDGTNGIVISILDGTYVTQLRTGAASGAAFDMLSRKDASKGALIGTGGQAAAQLEAMVAVRSLEEVKVYDMNRERTKAFADRMQDELRAYGTKITAAGSSDEAIEGADLIVTVTPSSKPVFDGSKVKKGATISCVGSYQPHMQEMDPVILTRASKIYFDSEEAVLSEAGDILIPLENGTISKEDFTGDLGEVIGGKVAGRENDDEIIVFKTVGIGTQDLITAKRIYDRAAEKGIGTSWS
jgi:ornithine cyclodeaminase